MPEILDKLEREIDIVERHLTILNIIMKEGPVGIIKLSEKTGWEQHKIRYSLRLLEKDGLIKPTPEGAIVTPKTEEFINELKNMLMKMLKKLENIYNKAPR
ncbi:MAG: winged helix-turn-helix transcriptional regulator [Thermoplasmata archaeon]|nr:winged helix-turn-helix transcriptional regulator [Thermoplasmata archaeon]